jgi:hypothetical protein
MWRGRAPIEHRDSNLLGDFSGWDLELKFSAGGCNRAA